MDRRQERELEVDDLGHGLDHKVGAADLLEVGGHREAAERVVALGCVELSFPHRRVNGARQPPSGPVESLRDLANDHRQPRHQGRLGDAGAHQPTTHDCNSGNLGRHGHDPHSVPTVAGDRLSDSSAPGPGSVGVATSHPA